MPPKGKYNSEIIIEAAFELVREEGFEQLSARNIAKRLGCSTQPIYSFFNSIEELEEVLMKRVKRYSQDLILEYEDSESNFLAIGLGYFLFARNEPELFRGLFIKGGWRWNFTADDPFSAPILIKMKKDKFLEKLKEEKLLDLFRDMFIYTHGLATQDYLSDTPVSLEEARELLQRLGGVLIVSATISGKFEIEKLMRRFHGWND